MTKPALARLLVVAGFATMAGAGVVCAVPLVAGQRALRLPILDFVAFLAAWGYMLGAPLLAVVGLVLAKGNPELRRLLVIQLGIWAVTLMLLSFVHL